MSLSEHYSLRIALNFLLHEPSVTFVQILMLLDHKKVVCDKLLNYLGLDLLRQVVLRKLLIVGP